MKKPGPATKVLSVNTASYLSGLSVSKCYKGEGFVKFIVFICDTGQVSDTMPCTVVCLKVVSE